MTLFGGWLAENRAVGSILLPLFVIQCLAVVVAFLIHETGGKKSSDVDPGDEIAVALLHLGRDLRGFGHDGERVEDLVVDELTTLDPLALLRQGSTFGLQLAAAGEVEHLAERGCR